MNVGKIALARIPSAIHSRPAFCLFWADSRFKIGLWKVELCR